MDADLEAGGVHLHDVFGDLIAGHGEDAVVAAAADVGLGQVGGAGGYGAVGDHLDAADAQAVVAHAGRDAGFAQGGEVAVPHQGVDSQGQVAVVAALLVGAQFVVGDAGVVDAGEAGRLSISQMVRRPSRRVSSDSTGSQVFAHVVRRRARRSRRPARPVSG